jgi:hypothetical protein
MKIVHGAALHFVTVLIAIVLMSCPSTLTLCLIIFAVDGDMPALVSVTNLGRGDVFGDQISNDGIEGDGAAS